MTMTTRNPAGHRAVSAVLFLCLFAAQAGAIALSPVLAQVARDLDVSTAAAGQVRTIGGLVAGVTALALGRVGVRLALGRQLLAGSILLALGSLASAAAPGIGFLAAAQVPLGAGIGFLTTAATLAAAEWVPLGRRSTTLSWALIGQPAAWIVGMPLVGAVGDWSWRFGWLLFPLAAALLAGAAVAPRVNRRLPSNAPTGLRATLGTPGLARWMAAELLANSAWAATLVYSGALFAESYGLSARVTGFVLAVGAGGYVAGNRALRRLADREPGPLLVGLAVTLAMATALFGVLRVSPVVSTAIFSAAAFAAGGRTFLSSAFGLAAHPGLRAGAMAMRAASMQLGYFSGSFAAGAALALGGYAAFGATVALLFLAAALLLCRLPAQIDDRGTRRLGRAGAGSRSPIVVASSAVAWSFGCLVRLKSSTARRRSRSPRASSGPSWRFSS